jgi:hypothetical protein
MQNSDKYLIGSRIVMVGTLVVMCSCLMISCGSGSHPDNGGNFSMIAKQPGAGRRAVPPPAAGTGVAEGTGQTSKPETSMSLAPSSAPPFTVAIRPAAITIAPGKSATATVTTSVTSGFDDPIDLTVSVPNGVHFHFATKLIPAPGDGTSAVTITVPSTGLSGTHQIHVTASDGTTSSEATLKLTVPGANPEATFQGCRVEQGGDSFQGAIITVANPGTYAFNAILYYGTDCNPNNWADQIGFGTPVTLGNFDYTFWFTKFANKNDMSTLWQVGSDQSQCVNYEVAPVCE